MKQLKNIPKTAIDIFRKLPEGTLCDVIDNVLYIAGARTIVHQRVLIVFVSRIFEHLDRHALGEAFIGPVDVYFEKFLSAVQPDLIYVSNENKSVMNEDGYFYGPPDLIVEVLSKDKKKDTVTKKSLYERAGVNEYHIVNPENRKIISYTLNNGAYTTTYEGEGVFKSVLLKLEFDF